ncbi:MAG: thiamine-phosphate kinase [Candidatus Omnitrophica bacterium]|nr:thiamine-phosphate kinase [Candidatus Omnitrophota bacterium]
MKLSEFDLIHSFKKFQNLSPHVIKGIGDDAAVLELDKKCYQLLTTDMLVESVHFLKGHPARQVGHKALACNISDIAAMGGKPLVAVVSLGIPEDVTAAYIQSVYQGMHACAKKFGVSIVGGDTVKADKLVINVALLGEVEQKYLVTRDGAKPGDRIFVTGPLGGSLTSGRHLTFTPRIKEAQWLVENCKPSSMMDISDGLAGDLRHILKASNVGATIREADIPKNAGVTTAQALSDGEDFELLFTLSPLRAKKLGVSLKIKAFEIGTIIAAPKVLLIEDISGQIAPIKAKGYTHF